MLEQVVRDNESLFDILSPGAQRLFKICKLPLIHLLKFKKIAALYDSLERGLSAQEFSTQLLRELDVTVQMQGAGFHKAPKEGPLVVVSNHPFGALDGVILMSVLMAYRPDTKLLANFALGLIPELSDIIINVNPFDTREARRSNVKGLRAAINHVKDGGCLVVFPSGEVSHLHPTQKGIMDPHWNPSVAKIICKSKAPVLPLYFHGRNSMFFNMLGLTHPLVRTALLPSEMLKKRGQTVKLCVGNILTPEMIAKLKSSDDLTTYLRVRSYSLRPRPDRMKLTWPLSILKPAARSVAAPHPREVLVSELERLPAENTLASGHGFTVFQAHAEQIPNMLHELGRMRELTFRKAGEGTGRELDLDTYDYEYDHLLLWHEESKKIAGAYRLGNVSKLIELSGKKGLYCSSLFKFKPAFFKKYKNSLELGRAVVHPDYQRDFAPLMLLWKGIGQYLINNPELRYLFGPCSIPLSFNSYTLNSCIRYLQVHHEDPEVARFVKGKKPPKFQPPKGVPDDKDIDMSALNFNGLNCLVKDMENGVSLPILFKHYLKLGGSINAFTVDRKFGSLDAFLMIDLANVPKTTLTRYMGKENAEVFHNKFKNT